MAAPTHLSLAELAERIGDPTTLSYCLGRTSGIPFAHGDFAEAHARLAALGAALGIHYRFEAIARMPNTRLAHALVDAERIARAGKVTRQCIREECGYRQEVAPTVA